MGMALWILDLRAYMQEKSWLHFYNVRLSKLKNHLWRKKKSKTVGKAMGAHSETLLSYDLLDEPRMTPIKKRQQQEER